MIYGILIFLHVIICITLVLVILMQASKGKGLAVAFGGAAMATSVLGTRGTATFLSKATTYLLITFMVNCILLSLIFRGVATPRSAVQDAMQGAIQSPAQNLPLIPGTSDESGALPGTGAQPTNQSADASDEK